MVSLRALTTFAAIVAALLLPVLQTRAAVPEYKLGDVAADTVVTPVRLVVIDPDATEALKQKLSQDLLLVVRHAPASAAESETAIRQSIGTAKTNFLTTLRHALNGRPPEEAEVDSPAYIAAVRIVASESPANLPFDQFAPLWIKGQSDHLLVQSLIQPVREVMVQPIVALKTDNVLPANQLVQLLPVQNLTEAPSARELEGPGTKISTAKILSLWRGKRLVETSFAPGQENMAKFATSFVQPTAVADPALTEVLRAKRREGVTSNETYEAAQTIVRKGQTIDRKALSALAAMREKSLIGTLQTRLDQEQTVSGQIKNQTRWIAAGLGLICLGLAAIVWHLRSRPSTVATPALVSPRLERDEANLLTDGAPDNTWRTRALLAEGKADRAHQAIRSGVLGWMREKIFQTLFRQRAELLTVQKKAEAEMGELEHRLESLHTPLQERIRAYEERIEELERELAAKGETNRELIGARIAVARQQLIVERERSRFGSN